MSPLASMAESAEKVGLAEAKASLSSLVSKVEDTGVSVVIMKYNKPAVLIVPMPHEVTCAGKARGKLHAFADASKRELEASAFERAMVSKHANAS